MKDRKISYVVEKELHWTKIGSKRQETVFKNRGRLSQSVECLAAEREVAGLLPGAGPILRVLKQLRNEAATLQTAANGLTFIRVARMTT